MFTKALKHALMLQSESLLTARTGPALCTSTFCTFPCCKAGFSSGTGATLMQCSTVPGSSVSHTCQKSLPFPENSIAHSVAQLEVHLMPLGDNAEGPSCSFLVLLHHKKASTQQKVFCLLIHGSTCILFFQTAVAMVQVVLISWRSQNFPETG